MKVFVFLLVACHQSAGFVAGPHQLMRSTTTRIGIPPGSTQLALVRRPPLAVYSSPAASRDEAAKNGQDDNEGGVKKGGGGNGWLTRLKSLPLTVQRFVLALALRLKTLVTSRSARNAMTPGRARSRATQLWLRVKTLSKRQRQSVVAVFLALSFMASAVPSKPRPPPTTEVPYSEVLRLVEHNPGSLVGGIAMGPGRWDFSVALPQDHPAPGVPMQPPQQQAAPISSTSRSAPTAVSPSPSAAKKAKTLTSVGATATSVTPLSSKTILGRKVEFRMPQLPHLNVKKRAATARVASSSSTAPATTGGGAKATVSSGGGIVPGAGKLFPTSSASTSGAAASAGAGGVGGAAASAVDGSREGMKVVRAFTRPVSSFPHFPASSKSGNGGAAAMMASLDSSVLQLLREKNIVFGAAPQLKAGNPLAIMLVRTAIPFAYLYFMYRMVTKMTKGPQDGNTGSRLKPEALPQGKSGFDQVAGISAAKQEVSELVDMLTNPTRYAVMGARLPAGILLVGPPGTGKTMLARAVAVEAGLPFFYCSGSDFMEMFVGRGAARVRSLFKQAKEAAPAIVFVDELDTIGRARAMGGGGGFGAGMPGNSEAEQTLNQLLACMDGLDTSNDGVTVIAATNRFGLLDDALTRPGRFDRVVKVELPDEEGRREILGVHAKDLKLGSVEARRATLELAAAVTPGASGAELAALVNEAAIRAVRKSSSIITAEDFAEAAQAQYGSRGANPTSLVARLISEGFGKAPKKKKGSIKE